MEGIGGSGLSGGGPGLGGKHVDAFLEGIVISNMVVDDSCWRKKACV